MTKKAIFFLSLFFISVGIVAGFFYYSLLIKNRSAESCSASMIVFHKETQANITFDFMYNKEKRNGIVSVSGSYLENSHPEGTIRRDISFTWTENHGTYNFLSSGINKIDSLETLPDKVIATVLPGFYVYPDKSITYSIHPQGSQGFLFTIGKRPLFFCSR
ncbi:MULTISPECIES: hypothetical protein [Kosakonia]|uniref:hypothetical protein n=1 Tax=Kosakonia TaxID=1330547 RepID=UPI0005EFD1D4|nr:MULTISPECIES: hypothetical protein [Kosakonia]MCZ3382412.1 hypothetical protein [Kosakonia sp. SOY2]QHM95514.1 hypothetical protein FGE25_15140 [Kosakonia sacchari]RCX06112.1 hypothetical protein DFO56_101249 [Kosakonia sp. AG348]